jgi:hypothetical protein
MGADLYLRAGFEQNRSRWQACFDQAVIRLDQAAQGSAERDQAESEAIAAYEQLYGADGYFRDPYNDWSVLWKFGLSWWDDVIPLLDEGGFLSPANAGRLLGMLEGRQAQFEQADNADVSDLEDAQDFRERSTALRQFLKRSVELKEPIECSLKLSKCGPVLRRIDSLGNRRQEYQRQRSPTARTSLPNQLMRTV